MGSLKDLYPPYRDRLIVVVSAGGTFLHISDAEEIQPHLRTVLQSLAAKGRMDAVRDVSNHIRVCATATLLELGLPLMGLAPVGTRLPVTRMYVVAARMLEVFHKTLPPLEGLSGEQVSEEIYQDLKRQGVFEKKKKS